MEQSDPDRISRAQGDDASACVAGALPVSRPAARAIEVRSNRKSMQGMLLVLAVIYTLYLARSFFMPLVLAMLLAFVLAPVVQWLERRHVVRAISAGGVVVLLVTALGYAVTMSIDPIEDWVKQAPTMLNRLERKVYPIKKTVEQVSKTAEQVDRIATVGDGAASSAKTVRVQSVSLRDVIYSNAQALIVGLVMVTFLLYFFLSWGRVLLIRIGELIGDKGQQKRFLVLTNTLEIEVSKYLFTITLNNMGLAAAVAAALYLLGMPNPLLWGAVAGLLNFVPYMGSLLTAVLIGGAALLTFDGLAESAMVVAVFGGLTIFEGQILTPLILGRRLALNPLVVFLSVVFWFWLWGVMGALMAVPLLIVLKIIGDHVSALQPVARLAGR
jgi:predicted PurR-regulated permease PerM